ncbi:hypothetical protein ILP92_08475 [Maribius pontilimi]|uniref:Uncharacterized protein n=1 Tax=Palleronia pontilimi TaxID=1964209 RepID=A0A934IH31_9RHOB|nr:hypothetical protein [Palleronia pontilimi]MBJ3762778.1 hypothetical protein [Palleronia pontilimi]
MFLTVLIGVCSILIVLGFLNDAVTGGDPDKQGDWLINHHAQLIRRGPIGPVLIVLGDVTGIGLVSLTISLQVTLHATFAWAFWRLAAHPGVALYVVAIDWERWIALHVFSATLFFLTALRLKLIVP